MEEDKILIQRIQIRRGTQAALELKLKGDDKPASGEPIFELPCDAHPGGRIKIGDGSRDYADLPYMPDNVDFLKWISQAQDAAETAKEASATAQSSAATASTAMSRAEEAAEVAKAIPAETMKQVNTYMDQKLHFLSMAEYNKLEELDPDGFYFIAVED